jgi:ribosomal 50S subunit-associated protein YjgA (DUF615 family)
MKIERLADLLALYQLALGAIAYCIRGIRAVLAELGNEKAVELADKAMEKCDRARQLQYDWEQQKEEDPLSRPEAAEIDNELDATLSRLVTAAEVFAETNVETRQSRLADEFLEELFPSGVYPITSQPFDEQRYTVDGLLERLHGPFDEHVQAMSLNPLVDELEQLNRQFAEELDISGELLDYKEVEAARNDAEDAFHRLIVKVMHDYGHDMEQLDRILEPLKEQTERARRSLKRTGRIPEVDDETGEPVNQPQDDGQPDGGSPEDSSGDGSTEQPDDGESSDGSSSEGETEETED